MKRRSFLAALFAAPMLPIAVKEPASSPVAGSRERYKDLLADTERFATFNGVRFDLPAYSVKAVKLPTPGKRWIICS
jgi:hypothetical protein